MKTNVKTILGFALLGRTLSAFAQKQPVNEFVSHIPDGRNILVQPVFDKNDHIAGKITIDFTVNKKGEVTWAGANKKATTIKNKAFIHKCEAAVKASKFSELKTAPDEQHGNLAYTFKR